jgi:hypothetical protein
MIYKDAKAEGSLIAQYPFSKHNSTTLRHAVTHMMLDGKEK